jgi:hypothetical protein
MVTPGLTHCGEFDVGSAGMACAKTDVLINNNNNPVNRVITGFLIKKRFVSNVFIAFYLG